MLTDGRLYACRKATSLGAPETPLFRAAIEEKFMKNATRAVPAEQARALMARVLDMEQQESLAGIMALCRVAG